MNYIHKPIVLLVFVFFACSSETRGQQPFVTDNSDVTPKGKFHFQFGNEYDVLQRSLYPALRQKTASFELDYGLFPGVEIAINAPLLAISNSHLVHPQTPFGIGDTTIHVKYNFYKEREGSRLPAMALTASIQFPTGDVARQLGSGLTDYFVNGILQKSVTTKTKLRLNGGILFAGNEQTGALGIRTRGRVLTGGGSLVKQYTSRLDLGVEITGAVTSNLNLKNGQLQGSIGGNYALTKKMTFDFAVVGGKFAASPRAGVQLGISIDF